jgi:hypothetical protein
MPSYPAIIGSISGGWTNAGGRVFTAERLTDLQMAYQSGAVVTLHFSGHSAGRLRHCDFEYTMGPHRPASRLAAEGPDHAVAVAIAAAQLAFPLPPGGGLIFLSWGGTPSLRVAELLADLLRLRFPTAEIFLSTTSIDPGDDPMRRVLEDGLLRCQVLIAALSRDAATRPWVIWETATVWARKQLVIPIFIDVAPADIPGPLTSRVQGVHLNNKVELDRVLAVIAARLNLPSGPGVTDEEHCSIRGAAGLDSQVT